ncbi:MAG TPA: hypothetical protein VMF58_18830 [Rhizomicrobium sp.]|nr:hypothetical protein [Rhizomicrobium sp.]
MSIIWDIWNTIHAIVTSSSMVMLIIGVVIMLGAAFMMQGLESLATTTLVALIAFALLGYVYAVTVGKQPAAAYATTDWHNFATMNGLTLLAYGLIFAVGIAVANLVLSVVRR